MDLTKLTPAQRQYFEIKTDYKDCILFFRMWDFYETFYEDAKICSKTLDIALTSRDKKSENPVAMAWVPYHSADKYIAKLVKSWFKVAIAEQVWEVKPWQIVKRQVTSVVTPWTFMEYKDLKNYNFILSVYFDDRYNICWWDFSVGEYWTKSFDNFENLLKFIHKINPSEIIIDINFPQKDELQNYINNFSKVLFSIYDVPSNPEFFMKNLLEVQTLNAYWKALEIGRLKSCGLLFNYLKETQKNSIRNVTNISYRWDEDKIIFDEITIKNLEIFQSSYESNIKYSLLWVIDNTYTPMWWRLLKTILSSPSQNIDEITQRQENIKYYCDNVIYRDKVIESLKNIWDIPRLITSIVYKKNTPLFWSRLISILSNIYNELESSKQTQDELIRIGTSERVLLTINDFYQELIKALKQEWFWEDMDFVADGYNEKIDEYRKIAYHSDELLVEYQQELVKHSWLNNVRIKYISNSWYFIEVSKKDAKNFEQTAIRDDEKFDFIRRQTLKIAERYTSPYLDHIQWKIIGAKDVLSKLEKEILENFKQKLESFSKEFSVLNTNLSWLDIFVSMSWVCIDKKRCFPDMNTKYDINIIWWRHPVIEQYLPLWENFVPNDLCMEDLSYIHTITWPNMWWKSTFLRQNAIIIMLAHCGFPVPAQSAKIWIVDWIFARVWSGDVIAKNQSTFMTEMIEVSNILHNATSRSFIVLDELWRGTSTYDGLALAREIMIYIAQKIKSKTLFATHYHELISLEWEFFWVTNFSVSVYETDKQVVFLKKIVKWWASKSYWIDVAKLAWIPKNILEWARSYLKKIEWKSTSSQNTGLFEMQSFEWVYKDKFDNIKNFVETIDPNNITPLQALEILNKLKDKI